MAQIDRGAASGSAPAGQNMAVFSLLALVVIGIPLAAVGGPLAWILAFGGPPSVGPPPVGIDTSHKGQLVAHIDTLGRIPPSSIGGIRITEAATHTVIWYVKPVGGTTECWNGCWVLKLNVGENPASFVAGHQQFLSQLPSSQTFSLSSGVQYFLEVWDGDGRIKGRRFTL
jgi:hypothetical protein